MSGEKLFGGNFFPRKLGWGKIYRDCLMARELRPYLIGEQPHQPLIQLHLPKVHLAYLSNHGSRYRFLQAVS